MYNSFGRVDLTVQGISQRHQRTCTGTAAVLLPSDRDVPLTIAHLATLDDRVET
jgi:hypothetical protein